MWIPLKKYCEKYEWPTTTATLRVIIWNAEKGLGRQPSFIHRYGKRVLIDGDLFQAWLTTKEAADAKKASYLMTKEKRAEKLNK